MKGRDRRKPFQIYGRRGDGESGMPKQLLSVYFLGKTDSKQRSFKNGKTSILSLKNFVYMLILLFQCSIITI